MAERERRPDARKKRRYTMTDAERQRRSELARQRHQEVVDPNTGRRKFGGPQPGAGRPRKPRASTTVAEAAQMSVQQIIDVFKDAIHPNQPMGIRLKAAEAWLGVEREEAKVLLQEADSDATQHDRSTLISVLAEGLTRGPAAEIIRQNLAQKALEQQAIMDAEVIDEDEPRAA